MNLFLRDENATNNAKNVYVSRHQLLAACIKTCCTTSCAFFNSTL